jgi:hypothetical protein
MLVFMVGSSGGSALLSGDHARFVAVPQRGQKTPREAGLSLGLSLKKGGPPHRQRLLLRARLKRPSDRRTAKKGDELAPPHAVFPQGSGPRHTVQT